jgi:hypothetical protein
MARCGFIKASGERCKGTATGPHGYCWAHDPANAEQRSRMASKAARSRPNRELQGIKTLLSDLTDRVLAAEGVEPLGTAAAAVANQLINTRLRAIEQERKNKESEDLEARIEALEAKLGQPMKGARQWQRRS